jgi:uncharacterized protein (TIGR02145 family)
MNRLIFSMLLVFSSTALYAQRVGIGTNTPHASAQLEVASTERGFLPPRMTFEERNAIQRPASGLMIWCTDCDSSGQMQVYNGIRWVGMMPGEARAPIVVNPPTPIATVTIGNQVWMLKNLSVDRYRNGDPIPQVTNATAWSALTTGAWCWYNNDSATYAEKYGRLYNWYAVTDPRGLAPVGYRVSTNSDWNKLTKFLAPTADTSCTNCFPSSVVGGALKDAGLVNWASPNTGGTNASGFTAMPGGDRNSAGVFNYIRSYGSFWTSTSFNISNALFRYMFSGSAQIANNIDDKRTGYSVRCVKE